MSYSADNHDTDKTLVMPLTGNNKAVKAALPFTQVAVPGPMPGDSYLARQTSLQQYSQGLNPLMEAASPLLVELINLHDSSGDDLVNLRNRLESAVRAFEVRALTGGIDRAQVMAARYVLCTALDETISVSSIGEKGEWARQALLSSFHNETWGGEKFFQVLERCMQQPAQNLFLLELMYTLISLGFEGRYRVTDRGAIALEALRDKVYRQIKILRGDPLLDLSPKIEQTKSLNRIYGYVPLWAVAALAAVCMAASFWGFSWTLNKRAGNVFELYVPVSAPLNNDQAERIDALNNK